MTEALLAVHAAPRGAAAGAQHRLRAGRRPLGELADLLLDVVDPGLRLEQRVAGGFTVPHTWLDVRLAADRWAGGLHRPRRRPALAWTPSVPQP